MAVIATADAAGGGGDSNDDDDYGAAATHAHAVVAQARASLIRCGRRLLLTRDDGTANWTTSGLDPHLTYLVRI